MKNLVGKLFATLEQDYEFEELDKKISKECTQRLEHYVDRLSPQEYEEIRDVAFSIYAISKRASFEMGFKTAMRLISECCTDEPLHNLDHP